MTRYNPVHISSASRRYNIVRFIYPNFFAPSSTVKTDVTLEEAQAHCRRPDTRKRENGSMI